LKVNIVEIETAVRITADNITDGILEKCQSLSVCVLHATSRAFNAYYLLAVICCLKHLNVIAQWRMKKYANIETVMNTISQTVTVDLRPITDIVSSLPLQMPQIKKIREQR
jgi:hypothetical protein